MRQLLPLFALAVLSSCLAVPSPEQGLVEDYDAVHIRTQAVFDTAAKAVSPERWSWDGIHPLPQGHELIARAWLQEVSARWK